MLFGDILNEAAVVVDEKHNCSMHITKARSNYNDFDDFAYFKYCKSKSFRDGPDLARISLTVPKYVPHINSRPLVTLSDKECENLYETLKMRDEDGLTNYQKLLMRYNRTHNTYMYEDDPSSCPPGVKGFIPLDHEIPRYDKMKKTDVVKSKHHRK